MLRVTGLLGELLERIPAVLGQRWWYNPEEPAVHRRTNNIYSDTHHLEQFRVFREFSDSRIFLDYGRRQEDPERGYAEHATSHWNASGLLAVRRQQWPCWSVSLRYLLYLQMVGWLLNFPVSLLSPWFSCSTGRQSVAPTCSILQASPLLPLTARGKLFPLTSAFLQS